MDLQLSGKRVFVTGASKGIGLAVARAFRQEGARVAINSSNPQNLARAQEVLGGDCLTLGGDLGDIDSIGSIFAQLEERWRTGHSGQQRCGDGSHAAAGDRACTMG